MRPYVTFCLLVFPLAAAAAGDALTIYSSAQPGAIRPEQYRDGGGGAVPGYAVVRHLRDLELVLGQNTVRFSDVAALIDPTTVAFESLTDPNGTRVLEQNFQFDLVNPQKLLEKYIDRTISVDQVRGSGVETFRGTLLSTAGGYVLRREDGSVQLLSTSAGVRLPELPGGLITRPTLVWDIVAARGGKQKTRVSYQTGGITWWADYNLAYSEGANANACKLDVGAWVSILNRSGAGYDDAKLKLVAGDVHRAAPPGYAAGALGVPMMARQDMVRGFEEKAFFEYHLYTLGRPTTLPDRSTKQIELFPVARGVPCEKKLVYYGLAPGWRGFGPNPITDRNVGVPSTRKIDVYLAFQNSKRNNMGMPLPAGRVRVSKLDDADGTLEFIGEDTIDHTPRDERVLIKLGSAFDVVGERRQLAFTVDSSRRTMSEQIEVRLRNHKDQPVTVDVKENLYRWVNWKISRTTDAYRKEDARTVVFPLRVAAGGEQVLRYTVEYSW
ncbi:MAG: DUF4139 domain-containing protein [Burkholderiales bacterium]